MLENLTALLAVLATITGVIGSLGIYPQAFKIIKRKSCNDVSLLTFAIFIPGGIIWVLYGISLNNIPVIVSNLLGLIGSLCVTIAYFIYKK